jgi:hypothetical protein
MGAAKAGGIGVSVMTAVDALPDSLRQFMSEFAARRSWQRLVRRLGLALLAWVTFALLSCLVDRGFGLLGGVRLALLIASFGLPVAILSRVIRNGIWGETDWNEVARSVERRERRCAERLVTVTSQVLGEARYRGSAMMLERVAVEVTDDLRLLDARRLLPGTSVAGPWVALAVMGMVVAGLWMIPHLDMPRLVVRFLAPLGPTRAATTTRLLIAPQDVDLVEGQSLEVNVRAKRLGDNPMTLHTRRQGHDWLATSMTADPDGTFVSSLAPVDQDFDYVVTGGDAESDLYHVRVLRKPVVSEFEVLYEYPSYTGMPPARVSSGDGAIEAPAGTKATVRIHSSEPLAAATMSVGSLTLAMTATKDPSVREATILIAKDSYYELGLSSTRGMVGSSPSHIPIKVIPDRAPVARLVAPSEDQWLQPGARLRLVYDVADDFALGALEIHVRVNPFGTKRDPDQEEGSRYYGPGADLAVRLAGDSRRQVGECQLDLSALNLRVGDFASIRMRAEDRSGQSGLSEPTWVVVAPKSVPIGDRSLALAMASAAEFAGKLRNTPDGSNKLAAGEGLRTSLLRAVHECHSEADVDVLARLADEAAQTDSISHVTTRESDLSLKLKTLAEAQDARNLVADLENLAAVRAKLPAGNALPIEKARKHVDRLENEMQTKLTALHIDGRQDGARDLLAQRMQTWESADHAPVDYGEAALAWLDGLLHGRRDPAMVDRLETAANVETIRGDGDLIWALDLQRAAMALTNFESARDPKVLPPAAARFPSVLALLQREHLMRKGSSRSVSAESDEVTSARQQLAEWANDVPQSAQTPARQLAALTLHASAETVLRNFSNALSIDRALAGEVTAAARRSARSVFASTESERAMQLVQALDSLVLQQDAIGRELERIASTSGPVGAVSDRQRKLTESLAATVTLAGRPGEGARLTAARNCLGLDGMLESLSAAARTPQDARAMSDELERKSQRMQVTVEEMRRFPGTSTVCQKLETGVLPQVSELVRFAQGDSDQAFDGTRLTAELQEVRPMLLEAAEAIVETDSLSVAEFHAQRAGEMLSAKNVEFGPTLKETSATLVGLRRTWDEAVHAAALARGMRLPALAKAMWEEPISGGGRGVAGTDGASDGERGVVPKGFEDSVKAYFQAMNVGKVKPPSEDE